MTDILVYVDTALIGIALVLKGLKAWALAKTMNKVRLQMRAAVKGMSNGTGVPGVSTGSGIDAGS